jgi:hypothetical protein
MDDGYFELSQTAAEGIHTDMGVNATMKDEEMVDVEDSLEREKEEMKLIDHLFEEKTKKLAHMINLKPSGDSSIQSKVEKKAEIVKRNEGRSEGANRGMKAKGPKFILVEKSSAKTTDKDTKVMDKAQARYYNKYDLL